MPIDIQCPDCDQIFAVPSSMAGKRILCRHCNAALIVPEEEPGDAEPEPVRRGGERPPNWDTPIPFHSPKPIVGVLLIALLVSVIVLVAYGFTRDKSVPTKPSNFTPYVAPRPEPVKPDATKPDAKPTVVQDREVYLPNREVIVPQYDPASKWVEATGLPGNWFLTRDSTLRGQSSSLLLREWATGRVVGVLGDDRQSVADSGRSFSPSGRWIAQIANANTGARMLDLRRIEVSNEPLLGWDPSRRNGGLSGQKYEYCVLLTDERLLTITADSTYDLRAVPGADYIRRVATVKAELPLFSVHHGTERLAIRRGSKIELYALGDDDFGPFCEFEFERPSGGKSEVALQFTPDGTRIVAIAFGDAKDRVAVFDIDRKKKVGDWNRTLGGRGRAATRWRAGNTSILFLNLDTGLIETAALGDGKAGSTIESGPARQIAHLDPNGDRVWFLDVENHTGVDPTRSSRLYGFDLPLRAPANFQKNPVWEYNAGVLELKKTTR